MATAGSDRFEQFGALVGWTHEDLGDRVMVKVQSKRPGCSAGEVDEVRYFMTKNQAAVLANYLYGISGRLPQPAKKRRWFA
ncbi:hypothetical protein N0B51_13720 [Tsuneonella sp. YG55]|uniref:Uncharacterized protein n=1 Tax=Tsuneonella litorea TaxID=2976475 RepID=A0A9X2W2S1_9SPHN|nr:hypothetical protein [Tsuneonella litorea]MCT2560037.1 hypothetical protein [Tsuneonella litorea]